MIEQLGVKLKNFSANEPSGEKPASVRQRRAASRLIDLQNSAGRSAGLWSTLAAPFHRSIHIRFQYVFGAAVFGLVFMALIAIISSRTLLKTYESSVEEMLQEMTAIEQLETSLRQANQLVFLYTVNGDQSALMRFNEIAEDIDPQFHLLARAEVRFASVRYSNSELALPVFTAAWHEAEAALQEVFRYAPGTPEAINALAQLNEVIEPIYGTFSEFRSLSLQDVQSHLKSAQSAGTQAIFTIFGGILAGLVLAAGKLGRKDFTHRVKLQNTRDELGQLGRAFNVAATALQRLYRELERRSTHDGLTDVLNRAGFDERFSAECQSAIELDMPLALLLVDVDFFKQVNDTHGHQVGDRVLQVVAGLLGETLRPDDVVARYGGEEFAIILPETDEQSAMAIAQRLLTAIENASIKEGDGEDISVTVSIGCASHQEHGMTPEDFVKNADAALYEAKQTGRNRVVSESDRLLSEYAHWNTDAA